MRLALWIKTINDAWILTAATCALLFIFSGLYVYMGSQFEDKSLESILELVPDTITKLSPIPIADLVRPIGRIAGLLIDPTMLLTCALWAVARGSDAVSGEINRGTMEMLLAQPIPRYQVMLVQMMVTIGCILLIGGSVMLGCWLGLYFVHYEEEVSLVLMARGVVNLMAMTFSVAGVVTLLSSMDRYRWRTLSLGGGFVVVSLIIKVLSRLKEEFEFLRYFTVYGAYEPWWLIDAEPERYGVLWLGLNGTLLLVGTATYLFATIIFCRRDVPPPL